MTYVCLSQGEGDVHSTGNGPSFPGFRCGSVCWNEALWSVVIVSCFLTCRFAYCDAYAVYFVCSMLCNLYGQVCLVLFRARLHDEVVGMLICMYKYLYCLVAHMRRAAV